MNIVVCVKQVVDTQSPIKIVGENSINSPGLPRVVNPCDLVAVEEAIQLKEKGAVEEVIVVSMGPPSAEDALCRCLAIGANRALLLCDSAFDDSDSYATAIVLAKAISSLKYGLILCGQRTADIEAGQVGYYLAEMLDIPIISGGVKMEVSFDSGKVTVHRKLERGNREILEAPLPALVAVEEGLNEPRYVSRRAVLAAKRMRIEQRDIGSLGLDRENVGLMGSKTKVISFSRPKPKKIFVPDSHLPAMKRLEQVISGGLKQKRNNIISGSSQEAASKLVEFLAPRVPSI